MKQIDLWNYETIFGELITLKITPFHTSSEFVQVAVDGQALPSFGGATPRYNFTATNDQHVIAITTAPANASPNAKYEIEISGSQGGQFQGPTITEADSITTTLLFTRTGGPR